MKPQVNETAGLWKGKFIKQQVDEFQKWWNTKLMKFKVGEIASWWNGKKMKSQLDEMVGELVKQIICKAVSTRNFKYFEFWADKTASWLKVERWNGKQMKAQVDEMVIGWKTK